MNSTLRIRPTHRLRTLATLAVGAFAVALSACEAEPADPPVSAADVAPSDAAPDAAPSDAAPDADAAAPIDPRAACAAATDADGCAAVVLPVLSGDSWQRCLWLEQHRVRPGADACETEASARRCVHLTGGEGSYTDLFKMCLQGVEPWGSFVYEERADGVWIGAIEVGHIEDPDIHRCWVGDDAYGAHPACRCPCLPGYGGEACEALTQARSVGAPSGLPSGLEMCTSVPPHRAAAVECEPLGDVRCTSERGTCSEDTDCAAGERCATGVDSACECVSTCTTDADCGPGRVCLCSHTQTFSNGWATRCVDADCVTDADCGEGEVCAVSYTRAPNRCKPERLACQRTHDFCDGVICGFNEYCAYDEAAAGWRCRRGCSL